MISRITALRLHPQIILKNASSENANAKKLVAKLWVLVACTVMMIQINGLVQRLATCISVKKFKFGAKISLIWMLNVLWVSF